MIAALVLVALVAVSQAQAMPEQRRHELQPFFDTPDFTVGFRWLGCVFWEIPEISTVTALAREHKAELLEAGKQLAKRLASCYGADDIYDCIENKTVDFLNAEQNTNVHEVLDKAGAINNRVNKCVSDSAK